VRSSAAQPRWLKESGAQLVIPSLILTDITTSMMLLSRHTCRVATAYGFSSRNPENLPHLVAAMAPQSETTDEGYLALKTAVVTSIRESGMFTARTAGVVIDRQLIEREAPQMIRLITYVADRLGIVMTQKELGILVPVVGAVLNSSINIASAGRPPHRKGLLPAAAPRRPLRRRTDLLRYPTGNRSVKRLSKIAADCKHSGTRHKERPLK